MNYGKILAKLRKDKGHTQSEVAEHLSHTSGKPCSFKVVSHWENGVSSPSVEQFLLLCEHYGVRDIQSTFRGVSTGFSELPKLNALGRSMAEEYLSMLSANPLFSESEKDYSAAICPEEPGYDAPPPRTIKLFDIPVAAGAGTLLDSDRFTQLDIDESVPHEADFAVRVSGDSMEPRFTHGQIIFVKEQQTLQAGEIGIFALNGDSYIKKLGRSELISLNPLYAPIAVRDFDSFHIFGKVVG
ncbi:MAG: XRE family transcriptional regulator [Oscillospiraceae bacterium]|nr:XRE family transcriptional regulator [Oscillospiraceae bacterium]